MVVTPPPCGRGPVRRRSGFACPGRSAAARGCIHRSRPRPGVRAVALVGKDSRARNSNSRVECQASMAALSSAEPACPWTGECPAGGRLTEGLCGVLAALVGVQDHPGDLAAAHRHRHREGAGGQLGVVVLGQGEPDHPPGEDVQHRGQMQPALPGFDLGSVTEPLSGWVDRLRTAGAPGPVPATGRRRAGWWPYAGAAAWPPDPARASARQRCGD
jgi:hypothetical protein